MGGHNGIKGNLLANSGQAQGLATLYGNNAAEINNTLTPQICSS